MRDPNDEATGGPPASFARRLVAFLLDGIVLAVAGFALLALVSVVAGPTVLIDPESAAMPVSEVRGWRVVLNAALLAALSGAYFVISWLRAGWTPGQRIFRIAVRGASPATGVGPRQAILRWALLGAPLGLASALTVSLPLLFLVVLVASFAWFVVLIVTTLFSRTRRGLHDRLSDTAVFRRT
jgi:uncharacterized RDD family membrane protein YckC